MSIEETIELTNKLTVTIPKGKKIKDYTIYLLTNQYNEIIYIGISVDAVRRLKQHRQRLNQPKHRTTLYRQSRDLQYTFNMTCLRTVKGMRSAKVIEAFLILYFRVYLNYSILNKTIEKMIL